MAENLLFNNDSGGVLSNVIEGVDSNTPSTPVDFNQPEIAQSPEQPEEPEGLNLVNEASAVIGGGAIDAVESVGDFAELTGDTLKTGLNYLTGQEIDETQNPFNENYIHGDANFLDIPDRIEGPGGAVLWEDAQPKTAIGKFGRGLVEFGLLAAATGGVGGKLLGGAKIGARSLAAAQKMGIGATGTKYIKFIGKGVKIGSEGAIADLITTSSEHGNIMNLAQEHIPWAVPIIGEMVAIKPEDNPWLARFKTVVAGAGLNYVGAAIGAIYKGFWRAGRERLKGASIDEANLRGNEEAANYFQTEMELDSKAKADMALEEIKEGKGLPTGNTLDEYHQKHVPERFNEYNQANVRKAVNESRANDSQLKMDRAQFDRSMAHLSPKRRDELWNQVIKRRFVKERPEFIHATSVDAAERIARTGFRGSPAGAYGPGVYAGSKQSAVDGWVWQRRYGGEKATSFNKTLPDKDFVDLGDFPVGNDLAAKSRQQALRQKAGNLRRRGKNIVIRNHPKWGDLQIVDPAYANKKFGFPKSTIKESRPLPTGSGEYAENIQGFVDRLGDLSDKIGLERNPDAEKFAQAFLDEDLPMSDAILDRVIMGESFESVIAARPKPQPFKTNIEAGRGLAGNRGADYIKKRLRSEAMYKKALPEEVQEIEAFMDTINARLFDDVAFGLSNRITGEGQFEFASKMITIKTSALKSGDLPHVMVHELWHTLSRYLPKKDLDLLNKDFWKQRTNYRNGLQNALPQQVLWDLNDSAPTWLTGGKKATETIGKILGEYKARQRGALGKIDPKEKPMTRLAHEALDEVEFDELLDSVLEYTNFEQGNYTEYNYRFKDVDEFFAENMYEHFYDFIESNKLAPAGTWERLGQEVAIIFKDMFDHIKTWFGGPQTQRIFNNFRKHRYPEQVRYTPLDLDADMTVVGAPPKDPDEILNNIKGEAEARGAEKGDIWDDDAYASTEQLELFANDNPAPFRNPNVFGANEKATMSVGPNAVTDHIREALMSSNMGGEPRGWSNILTESVLRQISRGDKNVREWVEEVASDLAEMSQKSADNPYSHEQLKAIILVQANDLLSILEGGGDIAAKYKNHLDYLKTDEKSFRHYSDNGNEMVTISPWTKAANIIAIQALAKQVQSISTGALAIADNASFRRQFETLTDSMKLLLVENKKMGLMWGLDGQAQQQFLAAPALRKMKQQGLEEIAQQGDEFVAVARELIKNEQWDDIHDLIELWSLSGGKVRTLEHIKEYLRGKLYGGRMDGINIKGQFRKELQGTFYNSILSSLATPVKAIIGTNMIATMRPMQAWLGANVGRAMFRGQNFDQRTMFVASAQMQNMGRAWEESLELAKRNWEMGVKKQNQSYQGKIDFESNLQEWKSLEKYYDRHGSDFDKGAYGFLNGIVNFNTSPWVRYSVNAMGAGDAAAHTIIGRQYMRQRAANAAWDLKAKNPLMSEKELMDLVMSSEDDFRDQIFKLDKFDNYIVTDKAARMAGQEASMTRPLEENFKAFELIGNIPGMKAFFPFARTGFNYLDVTFQHTPLNLFRNRYRDLKVLAESPNPSKALLHKYGIEPSQIDYELAVMEGRMAMGTAVIGLATLAALQGHMTGDMPLEKKDRDLWKLNGIKPNSFKYGNTYISYEKLEIFNTLFSLTANVVGHSDMLGEKQTDKWMQKLVYMASAVIVDQSMLSGVEDLARLINPRTAEDLLRKSGTRYIRSHLPYAGLMGQISDVLDSNQREAVGFWETLRNREPYWKRMTPPKYDVLSKDRSGTELRYGPEQPLWRLFNSLSPIGVTQAEGDIVKETLQSIRYDLPESLRTYNGIELNSVEQSAFQRELSKGGLRQDLERLFKNPRFKQIVADYKNLGLKESDGFKLTHQRFYAEVSKIFRRHKKLAMQAMLLENEALGNQVRFRKIQKAMGKSGNYDMNRLQYLISEFPK